VLLLVLMVGVMLIPFSLFMTPNSIEYFLKGSKVDISNGFNRGLENGLSTTLSWMQSVIISERNLPFISLIRNIISFLLFHLPFSV